MGKSGDGRMYSVFRITNHPDDVVMEMTVTMCLSAWKLLSEQLDAYLKDNLRYPASDFRSMVYDLINEAGARFYANNDKAETP